MASPRTVAGPGRQRRQGSSDRHPVPRLRGHPVGGDGRRERRHDPRPGRRHRQGRRAGGGRLRRQRHHRRTLQDRDHPVRPVRRRLHRRGDRRGRRHRRKRPGRQHHRRHRPGHGVAGEGVLVDAAERVGQGTRRVLELHARIPDPSRASSWPPAWSKRARVGRASSRRRDPARRRWSSRSDGTCSPRRHGRRRMAPRRRGIRASPTSRG